MTNTPLDAPSHFTPYEDDRPAGQWMEGYWADIAVWAKRLFIVILIYFVWQVYNDIMSLENMSELDPSLIAMFAALFLFDAVLTGFLGYFCFRFAQYLERALVGQDQMLLEKAFQQLHRFLIMSLVVAAVWLLSSAIEWFNTIQIMTESY